MTTNLDELFSTASNAHGSGIHIAKYESNSQLIVRNKIVLQSYLFSLLVEGTKAIHTLHERLVIDSEKFLLITPGNYLMSEKIASANGRFQSVLIFLSQETITRFFLKYPALRDEASPLLEQIEVFDKNDFTKSFIQSLLLMLGNGTELPEAMKQVKTEELLLYLCHHYPKQMSQLRHFVLKNNSDVEMKKVVESHIDSNVTLDELAFLCNMSLSTFKRKFVKLYGMAPSKWFLQRKMALASALLRSGKEKPSEVYYKVGYESHSSFAHSFKQAFGLTPTEYRQGALN